MSVGRTLVAGLGNPIVSDDGVGVAVAREVARRLGPVPGLSVTELYAGGLRLMDALVGYSRVVLIDAMLTGLHAPGTCLRLSLDDLASTLHTASSHDASLPVALATGRALGLAMPDDVIIWAVEAADVVTFSESLTPPVAASVERVADLVIAELGLPARTEARP